MKTSKLTTAFLIAVFFFSSCTKKSAQFDASGVFEATEVMVSAQASGEIMKFDVQEGDWVEAGQPLGYIDTIQLYLKKLQLETNIRAVRNQSVDINKQLAALEQQIATAQTEKKRIENLLKAGAANTKQLDDINAQIAVLEKQLAAQKTAFQQNNSGVAEQSAGVNIQIAQLNDQLKKSYIASPIDGSVLVKYMQKGELAVPGKPLFKAANMKDMFLRVYVTSEQLAQLKIGDDIDVFAEFGKKEHRKYNGKVTWISNKAEFTPKTIQTQDERANLVYAVKIAVENDSYLKIGMYGSIQLKIKN